MQDIIDAISHQEMKLHDMDDSGESYDPSGGSEIMERCDDCYKIRSVFIYRRFHSFVDFPNSSSSRIRRFSKFNDFSN